MRISCLLDAMDFTFAVLPVWSCIIYASLNNLLDPESTGICVTLLHGLQAEIRVSSTIFTV